MFNISPGAYECWLYITYSPSCFFCYNIALKADIYTHLAMTRKTSKHLVRVKTKMVLLWPHTRQGEPREIYETEGNPKCFKSLKCFQNSK